MPAKIVNIPARPESGTAGFVEILKSVMMDNQDEMLLSVDTFNKAVKQVKKQLSGMDVKETQSVLGDIDAILGYNDDLFGLIDGLQTQADEILNIYNKDNDELTIAAIDAALREFVDEGLINTKQEKLQTLDFYLNKYETVVVKLYDRTPSGKRSEIKDIEFRFQKREKDPMSLPGLSTTRFRKIYDVMVEKLNMLVSTGNNVVDELRLFVDQMNAFVGLMNQYVKIKQKLHPEQAQEIIDQMRSSEFYQTYIPEFALPDVERQQKMEKQDQTVVPKDIDPEKVIDMFEFQKQTQTAMIKILAKMVCQGGIESPANAYYDLMFNMFDDFTLYYKSMSSGAQLERAASKK